MSQDCLFGRNLPFGTIFFFSRFIENIRILYVMNFSLQSNELDYTRRDRLLFLSLNGME